MSRFVNVRIHVDRRICDEKRLGIIWDVEYEHMAHLAASSKSPGRAGGCFRALGKGIEAFWVSIVIEFPEGMPGDAALFLIWGP